MPKTGGIFIVKDAKTISNLITLLKSRKMIVENEEKANRLLLHNNYYRLSGYWRKFQINPDAGNDDFVSDTTFEKIIAIYNLDTSLRNLLQQGVGVFEICFRSAFAYHASHSKPDGQFLYLCEKAYRNDYISKGENPEDLLESIRTELKRSKERCVAHYRNKNEPIPMWAAVEVLSFGTISKMYSRWIDREVVKKVSQTFTMFRDYSHTAQIVRSLVNLRNQCAHQARLWNRELTAPVLNRDYLQKFGTSEERAQWRIISILMLLVDDITRCPDYSKEVMELCSANADFYKGLIEPTL